jgi:mono/diheme cytochrome c family protein
MRRGAFRVRRVTASLAMLGIMLGVAGTGSGQPPGDARQRLRLPPPARDKVLAEMRHMLESVNAVLHAVVASDLVAAEKAARASGTAMAVEMDPEVMRRLLPPFRQLGLQAHRAFDDLADRIKNGGTRDDAIRGLALVTGNCVACHAMYQLDEVP